LAVRGFPEVDRLKRDFGYFVDRFGQPFYVKHFDPSTIDAVYRSRKYSSSYTESFAGYWEHVTAEDYQILRSGRLKVGDALLLAPSSISLADGDEVAPNWSVTDWYNVDYKLPRLVGSAVIHYELGLSKAHGGRGY
jgi:hypothetical protein